MEDEAKRRKAFESRREREFYSYYESVLSLSNGAPTLCNLNDPESVANHHPVSSPDKALTAFAQLAACRLRTRRAMVFFFDSEYAYVLAEATRTLSLQDDSRYEANDSLWLGNSKIPRGFSVCEVTCDLPKNAGSNANDPKSASLVHIIADLRNDFRFCDRPYVNGGPMAKFYAGAPITTSKGINIGAFCVLDDSPRDGLAPEEIRFLCDMARSVMLHLELLRAKVENQRSCDMINALGAFVEGKARSQDWWLRDALRSPQKGMRPVKADMPSRRASGQTSGISRSYQPSPARAALELPTTEIGPQSSKSRGVTDTLAPPGEGYMSFNIASQPDLSTRTTQPIDGSGDYRDVANGRAAVMDRAANLICESLKVDGVLFLDATKVALCGHVNSSQSLAETTDSSHSSNLESHSSRQRRYSTSDITTYCPVLGLARDSLRGFFSPEAKAASVRRTFLRKLLRRHPEGHVWHFDASNAATSEESSEETQVELTADALGAKPGKYNGARLTRWRRKRVKERQALRDIFPGARSLLLVGMWDVHHEQWYAGCIVWSYSATRILSAEGELSYLAAFCDVVLAEVARYNAQVADRAKNDFISSISHELRSPLHGILGSAECLEDRGMDAVAEEMVKSVLSCATTLSDIINHLLEFSAQQRRVQPPPAGHPPAVNVADVRGTSNNAMILDALTENAVNAACTGYEHRRFVSDVDSAESEGAQCGVLVTLDIGDGLDDNWEFYISAGGYQRVCVNLVSNALKYTPSGYINITLRKEHHQRDGDEQRLVQVIFSVVDSGIGMSEEYQRHSLFRAFRQENALAEGTGLGLNLVAKIVKSYGGTVVVESKRGEGTAITVTLPLLPVQCPPSTAHHFDPKDLHATGALATFVGFADVDDALPSSYREAKRRLLRSLREGCAHLGMEFCVPEYETSKEARLYFVHEDALSSTADIERKALGAVCGPVIMVCNTRSSALRLRSMPASPFIANVTQNLWLPIGPAKLAGAVHAALDGEQHQDCGTRTTTRAQNSPQKQLPSHISAIAPVAGRSETHLLPSNSRLQKYSNGSSGSQESSTRPVLSRISSLPERGNTRTRALSLLLVDDNHVNLRLLTVFAERAGYLYLTAQDGLEAIEVYKRAAEKQSSRRGKPLHFANPHTFCAASKPDVILMDINMPGVDGFEAAHRIRKFEIETGLDSATIIALTGLGNLEAQARSVASGMDLFLTKPVRLKDLKRLLAEVEEQKSDAGLSPKR